MITSGVAQREFGLLQRLETFYRVTHFVNSIDNLEHLLNLIMHEAEAAVSAEASCIAIFEPTDHRLHITFASGEKSDGVRHLSLAMGQGILGEAAATRKTLRIDDAHADLRFDSSVDRKTGFTTRCIIATPIKRGDELLGVLEVINKIDEPWFTDEDSKLLEIISAQAAIAIQNAGLLERTVQSDRLSSIGKMAASVLHDTNNSMSVIRGFVELLAEPECSGEDRHTYSGIVLEEVDRFVEAAREVLDYSRWGVSVQPEEIQLGRWLETIIRSFQKRFAGSAIRLVTDFGYQGPVWINDDRMRRVVLNLASNAVDAMPNGGTIAIATRRSNDHWELEVRDTGSGIPIEVRSKIFGLFASFGKEHGTGLGLTIASEVVRAHGGTIKAQSKVIGEDGSESSGTTFTIRLPIKPHQGPAAKPSVIQATDNETDHS